MDAKTPDHLSERLRAALTATGRTSRSLAAEAGVEPSTVTRFLRGERDLKLSYASRLATIVGLELRAGRRGKRAGHEPTL